MVGERETIIRYLLKEMSEEEQTNFEKRYISDASLFEELLAVEDELIDGFVLNELPDDQREKFERVLLGSEPLRKRVEAVKAIVEIAGNSKLSFSKEGDEANTAPLKEGDEPKSGRWWDSLLNILKNKD